VHVFKDLSKMIYFLFPLLWLVGWQRLNGEQRKSIYRAWFMTFAGISCVGIVQFFTGWPRAQGIIGSPGYFHAVLFMGHHLSVASVWIFPFFALLDLALSETTRRALGFSRATLMVFIALGFMTLILTYARTLWAALPVGFMILALGQFNKKTAASMILFLLLSIVGVTQTPYIQDRWKSNLGTQERVELWKANLQFLQERPFFGVGLGKNQELSGYYFHSIHPEQTHFFVGHAHNLYLELLAGIGMVGTVLWMIWMGVIASGVLAVWRQSVSDLKGQFYSAICFPICFPLGVLCAGSVFLINGMTQVNFWEGKVLHQVMWVVGMVLTWVVDDERKSLT
jgi:O-antigen ligase